MSIWTGRKHKVSDPAFYDSIIGDQRKYVREHSDDPEAWLELGRLHEARIDMIRSFSRSHFYIRYFLPLYSLLCVSFLVIVTQTVQRIPSSSWELGFISMTAVLGTGVLLYILSLRYPPSGKKYFKKTIVLDPHCGDAYLYLGLIAVRRFQKREASRLWEEAIRLGVANRRIEQELKSLYEKEFEAFFRKKTEREIRQQEIIDSQQEQITIFRTKVASLESRNESLSGMVQQAKWDTTHQAKQQDKEVANRIAVLKQGYEQQIADLKKNRESEDEAKELKERDFVRLTTQIMEAKAALEGQSLAEAARTVQDPMGERSWRSLSEQTRSYLATAEQIATMLAAREEDSDYSLVGMELCKALETEINRVLVEPFVRNLNGNQGEFLKTNQIGVSKGKPVYYTYLAKVVDQEHFPEVRSLTLGQYHFVLKRALEDEYALSEYRDFLNEACSTSGGTIGKAFMRKLEIVTKRYRNAIAHESPMNKNQYGHLRNLIFAGKKALLKTLG